MFLQATIVTLLGLSVTIETSAQGTTDARDALAFSMLDESGLHHFESLKIGTSAVANLPRASAERSPIASFNDVFVSTTSSDSAKTRSKFQSNIITNNTEGGTRSLNKKELARVMRLQFEKFKQSLGLKAKSFSSQEETPRITTNEQQSQMVLNEKAEFQNKGSTSPTTSATSHHSSTATDAGVGKSVVIGEVVTKSERRAGEEPSGVRSGFLRIEAHPIPVTFTSLPGFPSIIRTLGIGATSSLGGGATGSRIGVPAAPGVRIPSRVTPATASIRPAQVDRRFPNVVVDTAFGGSRGSGVRGAGFDRIPSISRTSSVPAVRTPGFRQPGDVRRPLLRSGSPTRTSSLNNGIGHLMRLLESRLIGGLRSAGTTIPAESNGTDPNGATLQQFDPSIVVNFLTLVALTQQQRSGGIVTSGEGRGPQSQRNASPGISATMDVLDENQQSGSEFGPFSDGKDPSAGVDPSTIALPPMLRQTLYSYLLPRLASLTALVETVPGVPGLDYPIISVVPYTNFYCSNMPWPGFYADTEARCQLWHYCDLEGRQASFLCPNGTIFNQAFFVCDWWYNFDCPVAPYLYSMNERVFKVPEVEETAPHRTLTAEILDTIFL